MIRAIEQLLIREWVVNGLAGPRPQHLAFIQLSSTWLESSGRVVFLGFRPGDEAPCVVARIIRSESYSHILINEHNNLVFIHANNALLYGSIPRPLFCGVLDGKMVRIETALDGIPLATLVAQSIGRPRQRIVVRAYSDLGQWLVKFGRSGDLTGSTWHPDRLKYRFHNSINQFCQHFELDSVEREYICWLQAGVEQIERLKVPIVPNHGDLAAGAVLVRGNGVGVIDWEYYHLEGLPLFDHIMAVIQAGFSPGNRGKALNLLDQFKMFFVRNWHSDMARQWLCTACHQFGLPESLLSLWLPLFLIEMSNGRDWVQKVSSKRGEGSWRALFSYYVYNRDRCRLTG